MQLIGAALIGLMRVAVPPQAAPEADIAVSRTPTTNMGLDLESRRLLSLTAQQRLAMLQRQQQLAADDVPNAEASQQAAPPRPTERLEREAPTEQLVEALEASRIGRADRPHRLTRQEGLPPSGLDAQEVQLIQAHYRDQALFSPAVRMQLLARSDG